MNLIFGNVFDVENQFLLLSLNAFMQQATHKSHPWYVICLCYHQNLVCYSLLVLQSLHNVCGSSGHLHFAFLKKSDHRDGKLYRCSSMNPNLGITVSGSDSTLTVHGKLMPIECCGYCTAQCRALCRIKLLPVTCFGGHIDVNC